MQVNRLIKLPIKPSNVIVFPTPSYLRAVIGQISNLNAQLEDLHQETVWLIDEYEVTISTITGEAEDE